MKLLLLDQFSDPGGAQQVLLELLPAFRDLGWTALTGMPGAGEMFERVRALGFEAERIECGPFSSGEKSRADLARFAKGTPRLLWQLRQMAARVRPNLVYVNGPRLLPAVALARLGAPVLFHSHSYLAPGFSRKMAGVSLRLVHAQVLASCRFVAEPWRNYVGDDRISVIYNGVAGPAETAASPARQSPSAAPAIGCIGRIAPEKGQREFLEAAFTIHRALPAARFFIYGAALFSDAAGTRYDADVRAAANGLPVEFRGWVNDAYAALAELDLLLVPSAGHEATTRVILEAFAAGVPVIAFRSGGIPEVIQEGVDGLLAGSVEEMARLAIGLMSGEPARLAALTRAGRESWLRNFTLDRFRRQVVDAVERAAR
jgi:hypothetical protein